MGLSLQFMQSKLALAFCLVTSVSACGKNSETTTGRDPSTPISLGRAQTPNPDSSNPIVTSPGQKELPSSSETPQSDKTSGPTDNSGSTTPQPPINQPIAQLATLTVVVNNLHNTEGNFCLSIFNSPDGFPDSAEKAILAECFTVSEKTFSIEIRDLPAGRYAIAGWHDENKDKKLNYNFLGIPKEGLAFSENGKPRLSPPPGPPSFDSIAFDVGSENRTTQMKTTYLLDLL